jgi:6-phosphofructokinase
MIQTIGIANGGGDCPGLNAVIRGTPRAIGMNFGDCA